MSGCRCAPTRCTHCTGRGRSRKRRRGVSGLRSTSSCSCSSASRAARGSASEAVAPALGEPGELIERYRGALPFALTEHQERAIEEIDRDLARDRADAAAAPGRRRLRARPWSRSTRCSARSRQGFQGALMAPTETLAEQHFLTVEAVCRELGVTVGLLTSSVGKRRRATQRRRVDPRRHARADPGGRRARPPGRRGRRRAAPLRRRAARRRSPRAARRTSCT